MPGGLFVERKESVSAVVLGEEHETFEIRLQRL
jgi:hypothetical protein